ncbi:MAG TPA: acyl-ACP--UDP-N-acetylglucosamine O-acyltransferase [Acidiferrobacteraceae bacterium]|nr:acyl-ACP--UDP-N-acetylglucosamine O-acyltransferase [Acidiferrobacteraceae bacterium]
MYVQEASVIDPRAVVASSAQVAEDVEIGPFSVIGPEVQIGAGCWIGPHVVITGATRLGRNNRIYQFASLGEVPQDLKYRGEQTRLELGDDNTVREGCTMSRGTVGGGGVTQVGNGNLFMAYVHIAHDCVVGNGTIFANCASLAGHVTVEDYAVLGGFTGIHQFCRVGAHSITAIGTVSFKDIPPFITASGSPAEPHGINITGLKRRGFTEDRTRRIRQAYKLVYRAGLRVEEALEQIRRLAAGDADLERFSSFIAQSARGIIR